MAENLNALQRQLLEELNAADKEAGIEEDNDALFNYKTTIDGNTADAVQDGDDSVQYRFLPTAFQPEPMSTGDVLGEMYQRAKDGVVEIIEELPSLEELQQRSANIDPLTGNPYDRQYEGFEVSKGVRVLPEAARRHAREFHTSMSHYIRLHENPTGLLEFAVNSVAGLSDEELEAKERETAAMMEQAPEFLRKLNPHLPPEAFGVAGSTPYMVITTDGQKEYYTANIWRDLYNNKYRYGGGLVGATAGTIQGLKIATATPKPPPPIIRGMGKVAVAGGGATPVGRGLKVAAQVLKGAGITYGLSSIYEGAGAGAGQLMDDYVSAMHTATELRTAVLAERAMRASIADASDNIVAGPIVGLAGTGLKLIWNGFLGRFAASITGTAATGTPVGIPIDMAIAQFTGPNMFNEPVVRRAMIAAGADPDDVVHQQIVRKETANFLKENAISEGTGKVAKFGARRDTARAYGMQASEQVSSLFQTRGFGKALKGNPDGTPMTAKQQQAAFDEQFGVAAQGKFNAQSRLNQIEAEYPGFKGMPDNVANEVMILKSGIQSVPVLNDAASILTRPEFWRGNTGVAFGPNFMQKLIGVAEGLQISRAKIHLRDFNPKNWTRPKEGAPSGTIPPALAVGLRGEVLDQPARPYVSVAVGMNASIRNRMNGLNFLQDLTNIYGEAIKSPQALAFNPLIFRQLESGLDITYEGALQATRAFSSGRTYQLLRKEAAGEGMSLPTYTRAATEVKGVEGPSATFLRQVVEKIDPVHGVYDMDEIIDMSVFMRSWLRNNKFNKKQLPFGQDLVTETLKRLDTLIARDLGATAQGKDALGKLQKLRDVKKSLIEVKSNRAYRKISEYTDRNVGAELTEANILDINEILRAEAIASDGRSMTLLLNQLPKPQARALADFLFQDSYKRNLIITPENKKIADFGAMAEELAGLRGVNLPFVQAKLHLFDRFNKPLGGAATAARATIQDAPETIFRQAFQNVGSGGIGAGKDFAGNFKSRFATAAVTGLFNMVKLGVFGKLGWKAEKFDELSQITAKFFEKPLNVEASSAMQREIAKLKADAVRINDDTLKAQVREFELTVKELQDAEQLALNFKEVPDTP